MNPIRKILYKNEENNTTYPAKANFVHGSRERNEVNRLDHPACDPVTALRSVLGYH